jgi:hypothetical protein
VTPHRPSLEPLALRTPAFSSSTQPSPRSAAVPAQTARSEIP